MFYIEYLTLKAASYAVYGIYLIYMLLFRGTEKLIAFMHCTWILIRRAAIMLYLFARRTLSAAGGFIREQKPAWEARIRGAWDFRVEVVAESRRPLALPCSDEWD